MTIFSWANDEFDTPENKKQREEYKQKRDQLRKETIKKYGDIIVPANQIIDKDRNIISISPMADYNLNGGIPEGSWLLLSGPPKCGKMQPLDAKILTPMGYTTIGDIKKGQAICSTNNDTTQIVDIFDNGVQPVYKIIFDNGDCVRAGLEHLWKVKSRLQKQSVIKNTQEILQDLTEGDGRPRWSIELPICYFREQHTPIKPYTLGALIGDGSFTGGNRSIRFTTTDEEILNKLNNELKDGYDFKLVGKSSMDYRLNCNNQPNIYINILQQLQLYGHNAHTKFIPHQYKFNSIENRLELLRGLMDTDGTISKLGHCSFSSVSERLANDVKDIVLSLGGLAKVVKRTTTCNNKTFESYRCHIRFNDTSQLFYLFRKRARCKKRTKNKLTRKISDIVFDGYKHCKCIQVAKQDGLYITDNCVITHNTVTALQIASNAQRQYRKPVYYGNVEHRIEKKELTGIHGLNMDDIEMIQSYEGKIMSAQEHLQQYTTILKDVPGCILIIDSTSALCSEGEFGSDITAKARNEGPKLLATFCRRMGPVVPVNRALVIVIQHLIANTSGYGEPHFEDGGRKIQYQGDTKLRCTSFQKWENAKKEQIGQVLNWQIKTAALTKPGVKFQSYIRYGYGIDDIKELISLGLDMGLIEKKGTWYNYADQRAQGEGKLRNLFVENEEHLTTLKTQIESML